MKHKKLLVLAAKIIIVLLVVWGVHSTMASGFGELADVHLAVEWGWLTASGTLYLLSMVPAGIFWQRVMQDMGQDARWGEVLRAYYIGYLGKYVPGKAMVVILRAGLIRGDRVDTAVAAVSVFFETLTMMAVGSFLSAVILAIWYPQNMLVVGLALAVVAASGIPTLPAVFRRLLKLTALGRKYPRTAEQMSALRYRTLAAGWIGLAVGWVLMGLSLWCTLRGIGIEQLHPWADLHLCTACVTLAVVAGFLSLIPAGLLVRDSVLTMLLAPELSQDGEAKALAAAVILRLVWLVAELGISAILYFAGGKRWSSRAVSAQEAGSLAAGK